MSEAKKAGKSKWILWVIIGILLLVIAAGAAWWFLLGSQSAPSKAALAQQQAEDRVKNTKFINLGSLVTNLQSTDGGTHYIQVDVELKTYDPKVGEKIKDFMPEIRNQILQLLAAQQADKVSDPAVRDRLLQAIQQDVNKILLTDGGTLTGAAPQANPPIVAAYFSSFVVQ